MPIKIILNNKIVTFTKRLFLSLSWNRKLSVVRVFDYNFVIDLATKGISQAVYAQRYRELDHTLLYSRLLDGKRNVLDLGANIGYYTLLIARFSHHNSKILCIEPDKRNLQILRANVALNGLQSRCSIIEGVVGGDVGKVKVNIASASNLNKIDKDGEVEVDGYSLDYLCQRFGSFDSLRMDIEGAEAIVLSENSNKFLGSMPFGSVIFMEIHPGNYIPNNDAMVKSIKSLQDHGFNQFGVVSSGKKPAAELIRQLEKPIEKFKEGKFVRYHFANVPVDKVVQMAITSPKIIRYIYCKKT